MGNKIKEALAIEKLHDKTIDDISQEMGAMLSRFKLRRFFLITYPGGKQQIIVADHLRFGVEGKLVWFFVDGDDQIIAAFSDISSVWEISQEAYTQRDAIELVMFLPMPKKNDTVADTK